MRLIKEFTKDELEIAKIVLVKKMDKEVRQSKGFYCAEDVMYYINQAHLTEEIIENLEDMLIKATKWISENNCEDVIVSLIGKIKGVA